MDVRISPHPLAGTVAAIPSKSVAHRLVILAALCQGITDLALPASSEDIDATLRCAQALGASVGRTRTGLRIVPVTVRGPRRQARLDVGESGSTLRFLLPVIGALGTQATIVGHGRLAKRPLAPLDSQLALHGVTIEGLGGFPLTVAGTLGAGHFVLPGNVSSQYVSGLLMAAPLMGATVAVDVTRPVESRGYIDLTIDALASFGVHVQVTEGHHDGMPCTTFTVGGTERLVSPGALSVEGDWSNAAFWLAAGAMQREPVMVSGLNLASRQGDRAIMAALALLGARIGRGGGLASSARDSLRGRGITISDIPDLAAPLAAVAAQAAGTTRLSGAGRLRLKESDRMESICQAIVALGGRAHAEGDDLVIEGTGRLAGGTVDAAGDHRIAMMAAVCAAQAAGPTTIRGAECVAKSYPGFFDDFCALGGRAERMGG